MARSCKKPFLLSEVVDRVLARRSGKHRHESLALEVFSAFRRIGPPITERAEPVFFKGGVLSLVVEDSTWLTELTFLRPDIVRRMNESLRRDVVRELRVRLGVLERRDEPKPRLRPLTADQLEAVERWGAAIANIEVRSAVMNAAARHLAREAPSASTSSRPSRSASRFGANRRIEALRRSDTSTKTPAKP